MAGHRGRLARRLRRQLVKRAVRAATGGLSLRNLALAGGAAAAVAAVLVIGFVVLIVAIGGQRVAVAETGTGAFSCTPSALGQQQIPVPFLPVYEHAAARFKLGEYGAWILAGMHQVETNFHDGPIESVAHALGPMQFLPNTWSKGAVATDQRVVVPEVPIDPERSRDGGQGYGTDGNGDAIADINNVQDAIHSTARMLYDNGAPEDWNRAIFAYNHAGWYVAKVLAAAERLRGVCQVTGPAGTAIPVGGVAGSPKDVIDTVVLPLSNAMGVPRTVAQNDAANAAHGPTVSGGHSDHQGPPNLRWAADMSNGGSPTPEMDRLAQALADRFGIPWDGAGLVSATRGRYRMQLIYRTTAGGNHFNHVHFGLELLG